MTVYQPHDGIPLHVVFETGTNTPADPDTVTFMVRDPEGGITPYRYGTDAQVVRNGVGDYTCNLGPVGSAGNLSGEWRYTVIGTGAVQQELTGEFEVAESNIAPQPTLLPGPAFGPCQSWIDGSDLTCAGDPALLDQMALEATQALFEISGRRFTGLCTRTVRPCREPCGCWGGPDSIGAGPWSWSSWPALGSWGWRNEWGDNLGCKPLSRIRLAGYPVRQIVSVKIDGVVLPQLDGNGHPNWRLDKWRELVRMDDPGPPVQTRQWPGCQNLSLDASQPGTFQVVYQHGSDPPQIGLDAAAALACLLVTAAGGGTCELPTGTTRVVRQGVTVDRSILANWFDPSKPTGIAAVDLFVRAVWPQRTGRRPAVWSPDVQPFARREGV